MSSPVLSGPADVGHEPSGADIWNSIVQSAIGSFRRHAFHEVSLELVALDSGHPIEVVEERFPTFIDLVVATVQVWNAERTALLLPVAEHLGAAAFLRRLVQEHVKDSSLCRLRIAVVNVAATPGHPMASVLQRQWIQFHALVERSLTRDVALGREPAPLRPAHAADLLVALYEGLQLQAMMRPGMDLLAAWDHADARIRKAWSQPAPTAVWEV